MTDNIAVTLTSSFSTWAPHRVRCAHTHEALRCPNTTTQPTDRGTLLQAPTTVKTRQRVLVQGNSLNQLHGALLSLAAITLRNHAADNGGVEVRTVRVEHACDQCLYSLVSTFLPVHIVNCVQTLKVSTPYVDAFGAGTVLSLPPPLPPPTSPATNLPSTRQPPLRTWMSLEPVRCSYLYHGFCHPLNLFMLSELVQLHPCYEHHPSIDCMWH
jgi:hypothetical protein